MATSTIETDVALRDVKRGENPLKLKQAHHVEFWAGNAKQSAFFYRKAFGFSQLAYSRLETGNRETASYVLSQGKIRFVITSPLRGENAGSEHIRRHGDGERDIALLVEDADLAFAEAVRRGAKPAIEPYEITDENEKVRRVVVKTHGVTLIS